MWYTNHLYFLKEIFFRANSEYEENSLFIKLNVIKFDIYLLKFSNARYMSYKEIFLIGNSSFCSQIC